MGKLESQSGIKVAKRNSIRALPMRFPKFFLFVLIFFPALAIANQDADFLAARDAFRKGDLVKLDHMAKRLKHSPLEPYLAYYQLRMQLETASAADIKKFLARTDETPVINRLRAEWLKLLGERQQWDEFSTEYPRLVGKQVDLTCYEMRSRQRLQEEPVLQ